MSWYTKALGRGSAGGEQSLRETGELSFWEHVEVLRKMVGKSLAVAVAFGILAFCFKEQLFAVVLAPKEADFVLYRLFDKIAAWSGRWSLGSGEPTTFAVDLINTGLAQQFVLHMRVALCAGVICASPYWLYQLFRFVSPALYADEKKYAVRVVGGGYALFAIGAAVSYFVIFPLTFRFLGTYQVSHEVANMISIESYISTLLTLCLTMGIVFEIPILAWFFAKLGFLTSAWMRQYRRHAIVLILVVAAVITPTSDVFTLGLVSLPMWLLYEASIWLVRATERGKSAEK